MAYENGFLEIGAMTYGTYSYEWGWRFIPKEDISVCGLRLYVPGNQTNTVNLWDDSTRAKIASREIVATKDTWCEALLDKEVVLLAGSQYTVSVGNKNDLAYYSSSLSGFTFNEKITYQRTGYVNGAGNYPSNSETNRVYGLPDIIIGHLFERLYLIRVGTELFTKVEGVVTSLGEVEVTSELFLTSGFEEAPVSDDLIGFENPEVLLWYNSEDNVPGLTATAIAMPKNNQQIITNAIDLTHSSITGIENAVADCDGELIIAVSFDDKQTWKAWNGETWSLLSEEFSGMSKETLESITLDQWNLLYSGATTMYLRVSLLDTTQVIRTITIDFAN